MLQQSERHVDARHHAARQEDGDPERRGHAGVTGVQRFGAFHTIERGGSGRRESADRQ